MFYHICLFDNLGHFHLSDLIFDPFFSFSALFAWQWWVQMGLVNPRYSTWLLESCNRAQGLFFALRRYSLLSLGHLILWCGYRRTVDPFSGTLWIEPAKASFHALPYFLSVDRTTFRSCHCGDIICPLYDWVIALVSFLLFFLSFCFFVCLPALADTHEQSTYSLFYFWGLLFHPPRKTPAVKVLLHLSDLMWLVLQSFYLYCLAWWSRLYSTPGVSLLWFGVSSALLLSLS